MLELLPLGLLLSSGVGTVISKRLWVGKIGVVCSVLLFVLQLFFKQNCLKFNWFNFIDYEFNFSFNFGQIEILLCLIINIILICLYYTIPALSFEKDVQRKFGILNIFIFFMCIAILSNNIFQFYISVEALGLISAFLVSVERNAEEKATRVFVFNKFASILFLIGIALLVTETKSFEISEICQKGLPVLPAGLLLIACFCKGAQMPFSYWLIDAVKANILASILIHAGTIVTIGIIFIAKFHFIFGQFLILKQAMIVVGVLTPLWMGCCALAHSNIKKTIACLTASSAGVMFISCGLGAYSTAILYLICHAFFKSMLFLAFAYLIAAMSGEKNIHCMGNVAKVAPKVADVIWISFLFASGFPFLAEFFSKVALSSVLQSSSSELLAAGITAVSLLNVVAIFRMIMKSLYGEQRSDEMTFSRASKSNEFNFKPFWILATITLFLSFAIWDIYKHGVLGFGDVGVSYNTDNYLRDSLYSLFQIIIAIFTVIVFDKWIQNRFFDKIALLLRQHKGVEMCATAVMALVTKCAKGFNSLQQRIAYIENIETFKVVHRAGTFLKSMHKNRFQYHISWVLFGVVSCIIIGIFNGITR